ncbi:DNA (cytosine-5-)-methyltransferase [Staphylococcus equorum]
MNYIELFAGAGGLGLGFEEAGFENVFSVEYDEKIAETYKYNFPKNNLLVDDIKNISNENIKSLIRGKEIDVVIGGPPCQGFSMAGRSGRTFVEDERNTLFKEFVRFVSIIKPRVFVMENVARMVSHNKGKTVEEIAAAFEELGYDVQYKVLQAENYEIPQKRQRIFFVGTTGQNFNYPLALKRKITVKDAIHDLPPLKNGEKSTIMNHFAMKHSEQMLKKMSYVSDGGNREEIPENLRPKTGDIRKYIRYASYKPSVTVTGDMRKVFHYEQNRALTSRELARLQTFPDTFVFKGNSISVQQQIGNAVPPKLGFVVANEVSKCLEVLIK